MCLSNRKDLYVRDALASLRKHVAGATEVVVVDDSGDARWRRRLAAEQDVPVVPVPCGPAGYTAAMRFVWGLFAERVFFLEEDFTFVRDVDLAELHAVLDAHPRLAQVALQRAPWYRNEPAGVIAAQRRRVDRERTRAGAPRSRWIHHADHVEHNAGWTGNPSLIAAAAFTVDWPDVAWSETAMGERLAEHGHTSAWFGREGDPPHVEHHGRRRAAHSSGY